MLRHLSALPAGELRTWTQDTVPARENPAYRVTFGVTEDGDALVWLSDVHPDYNPVLIRPGCKMVVDVEVTGHQNLLCSRTVYHLRPYARERGFLAASG